MMHMPNVFQRAAHRVLRALAAVVRYERTESREATQEDPPRPTSSEVWNRWKDAAKAIAVLLVLASPAFLGAQVAPVADSACYRAGRTAADSLGKLHLKSTRLTAYQARSLRTLDSLHRARCGFGAVVVPPVDSIVPPKDSIVPPKDSIVPPKDSIVPPKDSIVAPPVESVPPDSQIVSPDAAPQQPLHPAVPKCRARCRRILPRC